MESQSSAPGWLARCTRCDFETDLASLGWTRKGAYSWGKRSVIYCPTCQQRRSMQIIHVGEDGQPDQSFWKVLAMVLLYQAIIWAVLLPLLGGIFLLVRYLTGNFGANG